MLNDSQKEIIANVIEPLFNWLEQEVIRDVARRIKKTMTYTRTAELQAMAMQKLGYSPNKIRTEAMKLLNADAEYQKVVAENTKAYKKNVASLIVDTVAKANEAGNTLIAASGQMAWVDDMRVWESEGIELKKGSWLEQITDAYSKQTLETFDNITRTTGFKGMAGYESIQTLYTKQLNKAVAKITSGAFDQTTALNECIHELSQSGLRSVDFANGYSMELDSAAKNAIRTGSHQVSMKVRDKDVTNTGVTLVYVQAHANARNTGTGHANHEEWQGKVYSIDGKEHKKEAKRIGQTEIIDLWQATGYSIDGKHENDPLGLNGYNCRHTYNPFFEGASSIPQQVEEKEPVVIGGKEYDGYAVTQRMRYLERKIRVSKREREALSYLKEDTTQMDAKISRQTRAYKDFCKSAGVRASNYNTKYEIGADITKTDAYKEYLREKESMNENE